MSAPARHVFTYGTLMLPQVFETVTGARPRSRPAVLRDHARYALRGETYPGLVAEAGAATDGVLWLDVEAPHLERLDAFEGPWYERRTLTVHAEGATDEDARLEAETYLLHPDQHHRVARRRWTLQRFEARYLQRFLSDYEGFRR